jgi:hypothetical protein
MGFCEAGKATFFAKHASGGAEISHQLVFLRSKLRKKPLIGMFYALFIPKIHVFLSYGRGYAEAGFGIENP